MSESNGQSGVEIHFSNTGTVQAIWKALHWLHLDALYKFNIEHTRAIITIDGHTVVQEVFTKHFVPCPPGEHEVKFFFYNGITSSPAEWQRALNQATCMVTVEPGKVTLLDYRLRSLTVATSALTVTGTRDA